MSPWRLFALPVVAVGLATACTGGDSSASPPNHGAEAKPATDADSAFVGSQTCAECHSREHGLWSGSLHAGAMVGVDVSKGSAGSADRGRVDSLAWGEGARGRIELADDAAIFAVEEEGVDPGPYRLPYRLGSRYLVQYLAALDGGRLQALPVGYDVARHDWFDIFPESPRQAEDFGHWANRGMTANSECIECHTTGFEKGYDLASDSFESRWAEAGVGCEACHGPGRSHVQAMAEGGAGTTSGAYAPPRAGPLLDTCAVCHALRSEITAAYRPGESLLDHYEPVLLDDGDYHVDGQLRDEAYEWASFLQSQMYREGVTCLDCHDVHSGELEASGDALCLGCHEQRLADAKHTHHATASRGARCVACHMPEHVFMARDRRRDHGFVRPDPGLTVTLGVPNPCGQCHADQSPEWAAEKVEEWFPEGVERRAKARAVALAFAGGRALDPSSVPALLECARRCEASIRRASALRLLMPFARSPTVGEQLVRSARDTNDLVRFAAVWALAEGAPAGALAPPDADASIRQALVVASADPRRAIRINAAWGLRALDLSELRESERGLVERGFAEWEQAMVARAEDAETHHTLGLFHEARGAPERAEAAYRTALLLAPAAVPPRFNLAMLLVRRGNNEAALSELEEAVTWEPRFAAGHYALGLLHGERGDWREAVRSLTGCLKIEPYYPEALHNLAHAYLELDEGELANRVLEAALDHPRARTEALRTLVSVNVELGAEDIARRWARAAAEEIEGFGEDPSVRSLLAAD